MISDSIPNASIAMASSNSRDFTKKKRANRSAKLKQCKLDARREQWLSQVKSKGGHKGEVTGRGSLVHLESERGRQMQKLDIKPRGEEIYGDGLSVHHFSDSESLPSNSPTSHSSSTLGSNDSGVNFSASSRSNCSSSCGRSSSSSSNGSCSGNMSEDDDEVDGDDDGCLDDWEAVADALAATDNKQPSTESGSPTSKNGSAAGESGSHVDDATHKPFGGRVDASKAIAESCGTDKTPRAAVNCCAWRPDDAYRPQSLPNLSKQYSFPLNSERHLGRGSVWGCKNIGPIPTSCPICFEDFDGTDSSFLPCPCGFRLCLFCHKRILEEDGRCPGCRKQYEREPIVGEATVEGGSLTFRLARSCSMITRS